MDTTTNPPLCPCGTCPREYAAAGDGCYADTDMDTNTTPRLTPDQLARFQADARKLAEECDAERHDSDQKGRRPVGSKVAITDAQVRDIGRRARNASPRTSESYLLYCDAQVALGAMSPPGPRGGFEAERSAARARCAASTIGGGL